MAPLSQHHIQYMAMIPILTSFLYSKTHQVLHTGLLLAPGAQLVQTRGQCSYSSVYSTPQSHWCLLEVCVLKIQKNECLCERGGKGFKSHKGLNENTAK